MRIPRFIPPFMALYKTRSTLLGSEAGCRVGVGARLLKRTSTSTRVGSEKGPRRRLRIQREDRSR